MTLSLTAVNITLERGVKMERYYYRIMCIASALLTQFQLSVTVKNLMHTVHLVLTLVSTVPVSRAQVTGRAEFTSEQLRMREINTVNIRC